MLLGKIKKGWGEVFAGPAEVTGEPPEREDLVMVIPLNIKGKSLGGKG